MLELIERFRAWLHADDLKLSSEPDVLPEFRMTAMRIVLPMAERYALPPEMYVQAGTELVVYVPKPKPEPPAETAFRWRKVNEPGWPVGHKPRPVADDADVANHPASGPAYTAYG